MDELLDAGRFRSVLQWGKRAGIKSSTVHNIHDSGTTAPENVAKLARAAGVNPKDVFIRIGWFNEELSEGDPNVVKLAEALAMLPEGDARDLGADLAVGLLERLRGHQGQQAAQSYLRIAENPGPRYEAKP